MSDVTRILSSINTGDLKKGEDLLPLVYTELRKLAAARMSGERVGHTLQPTALVHEAWLKLAGPEGESISWKGKRHFFGAAAEAMRRILIDHARRKMAERRGGDWVRITFGDHEAPRSATPLEMIDLINAIERLEKIDKEKADVAQLRLFIGLTGEEIASVLEVSPATIKRRWSYVKAWLSRELKRGETKTDENKG